MLYMPGIFGEDLMDRWFDDMDHEFARMEKPLYGHNAKNLMKTDVREHDDSYEVDIELPGFHKDEVQLSLENGYRRPRALTRMRRIRRPVSSSARSATPAA